MRISDWSSDVCSSDLMVELPCFMSNLRRDARGINVSLNTRSIWPGEATTAFAAGVDCCSAAWAFATCSENCPAAIERPSAKERMTLDDFIWINPHCECDAKPRSGGPRCVRCVKRSMSGCHRKHYLPDLGRLIVVAGTEGSVLVDLGGSRII